MRVMYNNREMAIDGERLVPLAVFQAKLAQHIPRDWEAACRVLPEAGA